jgi:hypothetical protein
MQKGNLLLDPEEVIKWQDSFLDEIEDMNRFEEKNLDYEDSEEYTNE